MAGELRDVADQLAAADNVRVVILTGTGRRAFCAGADLTEFGSAPSLVVARQVRWQRDVWSQMIGIDKPVIAAVHGYCIGSGLEIALLCDIRIAAEDTVFAMPEVGLGMIPAAGGTQTLPRNSRPSQALDLLLTGRRFSAEEALKMGLVTRISPANRLREDALEVACQLGDVDPGTISNLKRALREGCDMPLNDGLELETRLVILSSSN
ncbi:3-hydroxypropionyl-coenzyme A dehydratase [Geodia barretti]|uniref:3-hydroxypropionyl-coenzyme A dehydratase n=2 Tax=Geodia barretti TaxID=519541 RepID=A0AA35TYZ1_GEOBA|nr:3-hydroxypropionyl-coenzyme A dehydratase [Geodia barretti]